MRYPEPKLIIWYRLHFEM